MKVKPCQASLFEGLDETQMQYAELYGYDNTELQYNTYVCIVQPSPTAYPFKTTVTACCREHARDQSRGSISVTL